MKNKDKTLLEWYQDSVGYPSDQQPIPPQPQLQVSVQEPQEKPESPEKEIDDLGEMYKALAAAKAIENKLVSYSYKKNEEDKKKIKETVKALVKKLSELVDGF
jgi:hypothetical protein